MLVERRHGLAWTLALAVLTATPAALGAESPPASEFLEYLGSWEEGDQDWPAVAEWAGDGNEGGEASEREDKRTEDETES